MDTEAKKSKKYATYRDRTSDLKINENLLHVSIPGSLQSYALPTELKQQMDIQKKNNLSKIYI